MAQTFQLSALLAAGGPALIVLGTALIVVCIIILERWYYLKTKSISAKDILSGTPEYLERQEKGLLRSKFSESKTPSGYVLSECLTASTENTDDLISSLEEIKGRAISEKLPEMERYINVLATLGTVSPYIGLLGTVFGIIRAFMSLDKGTEGMSGLNAGIAEALVATAAGLFVAIPSTMAFNFFRKRIERMVMEIEIAVSRLKMMMIDGLRKSNR